MEKKKNYTEKIYLQGTIITTTTTNNIHMNILSYVEFKIDILYIMKKNLLFGLNIGPCM